MKTVKTLFIHIYILILCTGVYGQIKVELDFAQSSYLTGEVIEVKYSTNVPLGERAWIGLFKRSTLRSNTSDYITYQYVKKKTSGVFEFIAPAKIGTYEFRVIDDENGKSVLAVPVRVRRINPADLSMYIVTDFLRPSQPFDIYLKSNFKMNAKAWVGIFKSGVDIHDQTDYEYYRYASNRKDDILTLRAPSKSGDYELRFYAADPGALVKRVSFRLGGLNLPGLRIKPNKMKFDPEEDIEISYVGHKDLTDRAWIGIFNRNEIQNYTQSYLEYDYMKPKLKGKVVFKAPPNKGKYHIRMFYTDEGPQLLPPITIEVTSSIDRKYIEKKLASPGNFALYGIYFDVDKSAVRKSSYPLIEQIAATIRANPDLKIRIEGHTDSQGDNDYNQNLSEDRAKAVKSLLINKYGVSPRQLGSKGHGESRPVGDNRTSLGRARNRRVELVKF